MYFIDNFRSYNNILLSLLTDRTIYPEYSQTLDNNLILLVICIAVRHDTILHIKENKNLGLIRNWKRAVKGVRALSIGTSI